MPNTIFSAARTTEKMVNRAAELALLQDSFCREGDDTRVIIIEGDGGLGKTRLVSEALWRAGQSGIFPARNRTSPDYDWEIRDSVLLSDLLDFSEVNLHTSENFFQRIRGSLAGNEQVVIEFPKYDAAVDAYRHQLSMQSNYFAVQQAAEAARKAFIEDYKQLASRYRIVWALDTAEQLGYPDAQWLLEHRLLSDNDLTFSTQQRLLELLKSNELPNTTVLLVGRPQAREYFDRIIEAGNVTSAPFSVTEIYLTAFSREDVGAYLRYLAEEYANQSAFNQDTATYLKELAADDDRVSVLHLYTGGQPVSLALFVDALAEGNYEPEALQDTFSETMKRLSWDETTNTLDPKKLKTAQFQIEEQFIRLIFSQKTDLRSRILTTLVRARRGLDSNRLIYIFSQLPDAPSEQSPDKPKLRQTIEKELDRTNPSSIRWLSFVKERGDGKLILQDELYRIYDRHMTLKVEKDTSNVYSIVEDRISIEDETRERERLYKLLLAFVEQKLTELRLLRTEQRVEDLEKLSFRTAAQALSEQKEFIGDVNTKWDDLSDQILEAELERVHYLLRIDPDAAFNDQYADLAEQRWQAFSEEAYVQVRLELWRFLNDEAAQKFVQGQERPSQVEGTTPLKTLKRAAVQASIADWIKLFWLRGKYKRAIEFADHVEEIIANLPHTDQVEEIIANLPIADRVKEKLANLLHTDQVEEIIAKLTELRDLRITLNHTFSREERRHWREFSQIYLGKDIQQAINVLEERTVKKLVRLLTKTGIPEKNEKNFLTHPGKVRLQRLIGISFNTIGYGYATQGYYRKASKAYADSLRYLRGTGFKTQEAVVRNNLSRALSEMGLITRALRICEDGLSLKKEVGWEPQIAVSYSTLALIYNNALQPENAWVEAAKAVAYFRKLENERGLGLGLFHLAEALRRLAVSKKPKQDSLQDLFETARIAINEAVQIFSDNPESYRYIECLIEYGALYRDFMNYIRGRERELATRKLSTSALGKELKQFRLYGFSLHQINLMVNQANASYEAGELDKSKEFLQKAMTLVSENARKLAVSSLTNALKRAKVGLPRHQLDASIDLAYTYYYAGDFDSAERIISDAVNLIPKNTLLKPNINNIEHLPKPVDAEPYVFMLLAKIYTLTGELRLNQFITRAEEVCKDIAINDKQKRRCVVHDDELATQRLRETAEAYVLALTYSKLFSTRAPTFTVTMNSLYDYLRKFNETELEDFYKYQREFGKSYNIAAIESEDVINLEIFLKQSFGDYIDNVPPGLAEEN